MGRDVVEQLTSSKAEDKVTTAIIKFVFPLLLLGTGLAGTMILARIDEAKSAAVEAKSLAQDVIREQALLKYRNSILERRVDKLEK